MASKAVDPAPSLSQAFFVAFENPFGTHVFITTGETCLTSFSTKIYPEAASENFKRVVAVNTNLEN